MPAKSLKIVKREKPVTLWVHPEGPVIGTLFLRPQDADAEAEAPEDVANTPQPFLVLRRNQPSEIRFYNRNSIVRIEYEGSPTAANGEETTTMSCTIHMMDGSVIDGKIIEVLPEGYTRLYDYLNQEQNRFLRIYTSDSKVCLVNKSYIIQVTTETD